MKNEATNRKPARTFTYAVEVWTEEKGRHEIDIEAKNRTQAAAKVRKIGFEPRAVNYLG